MSSIDEFNIPEGEVDPEVSRNAWSMKIGPVEILLYKHGGINAIIYDGQDVTSNERPYHQSLVPYHQVQHQGGLNPAHGPGMPRVNGRISTYPGALKENPDGTYSHEPIHGYYAGLPMEVLSYEIKQTETSFSLLLEDNFVKQEIRRYYMDCVTGEGGNIGEVFNLIKVNTNRYAEHSEVVSKLNQISSLLENRRNGDTKNGLEKGIDYLLQLSFPGVLDVVRRVQVEFPYDANVPLISDTLEIINRSQEESGIHAAGFHTYWNLKLSEILLQRERIFGENEEIAKLDVGFDENLSSVQVRVFNQLKRLGRVVLVMPEHELANQEANNIIYHDEAWHERTEGHTPEAAVENVYQRGGDFPDAGNIVDPGQTSVIGMTTIIIPRDIDNATLQQIEDWVNEYQKQIGADYIIDLKEIFRRGKN